MKFSTIYLPSSVKNFRLSLNSTQTKTNDVNKSISTGTKPTKNNRFDKILVKQSYLILIWLRYISSSQDSFIYNNNEFGNLENSKVPSFFVYPPRNYRFTLIKSPMAHKTFSQEQFFFKNYRLSISFTSFISYRAGSASISIFNSLYLINFFFFYAPCVSTNMFFLQRYSLNFYGVEPNYFHIKYI